MGSGWRRAISSLLVILVVIFIGRNLFVNWSNLRDFTFQISFMYLMYSIIFLLLAWAVSVWIIKTIFAALGYQVKYRDVYIIYFRSILGKYVPGKIWQIAGSVYLAVGRGIPEGVSVTAFLLGQTYSILSGVILITGVIAFQLVGESSSIVKSIDWKYLPIIGILLFFALKPKLLETPVNKVLIFLNRKAINIDIGLRIGLTMLFYYLISWFIFGFSFWLFIKALMPIDFNQYVTLTAIHSFAIVAGFLALFAPGGIGVREGLIILLLTHVAGYQSPLPAIIAIGFRLITTVSELISFSITWIIDR